jgi:signal transduction histidine kinase
MIASALYQQARLANEMKDILLYRVTHDLRTPLASIKGFAESLLDPSFGSLSDLQRGYVARIHGHAKRVYQLAEQLLRVAKLESGVMGFHPEGIRASEVARRLWDEERQSVSERNPRFEVDNREEECLTWAVRADLESILRNLIGNAAKFTPPEGQIEVVVRAHPGEGTTLIVRDTGVGIEEEHLKGDRIFEPFYRAHEGGTPGFGYGLTLVKRLVDLHGGKVTVESEPGRGSEFTVWLPAAPSSENDRSGKG